VLKKIGEVAYELELPQGRKIHNVFHISCPKRALGQHVIDNEELPLVYEEGDLILIPEEILEVRRKQLRNGDIKEYLVKWKKFPIEYATWESEQVLQQTRSRLFVGKQFPVGENIVPLSLTRTTKDLVV
jgi:hypothetical protein